MFHNPYWHTHLGNAIYQNIESFSTNVLIGVYFTEIFNNGNSPIMDLITEME